MSDLPAEIEIVDYRSELRSDFERLNREWLESLFRVEPIDARVLGDPERYVIAPGGHILFALTPEAVVGTVRSNTRAAVATS